MKKQRTFGPAMGRNIHFSEPGPPQGLQGVTLRRGRVLQKDCTSALSWSRAPACLNMFQLRASCPSQNLICDRVEIRFCGIWRLKSTHCRAERFCFSMHSPFPPPRFLQSILLEVWRSRNGGVARHLLAYNDISLKQGHSDSADSSRVVHIFRRPRSRPLRGNSTFQKVPNSVFPLFQNCWLGSNCERLDRPLLF